MTSRKKKNSIPAEDVTVEMIFEAAEAVEKLCSELTSIDKKVVAEVRTCLRTIQEDPPRELKRAVNHGKSTLTETQFFSQQTRAHHEAGVAGVEQTCRNLGLEHASQNVRGLMRRAEHSARGSEHEAEEAASEVATAEKFVAQGVQAAEEVTELGRELLYLEDEVGLTKAVFTISRLLVRGKGAAESGLLPGGMSKVREAQKLGAKLEKDVLRLVKDSEVVKANHAAQGKFFADAQALVLDNAEKHLDAARQHSERNKELLVRAGEGLLTWRRKQEERLKAVEVEEKTKAARGLARTIKKQSDELKKIKSDEVAAKKNAAEKALALLDSRPELMGPCKCGRPRDCAECAAKARKATKESSVPKLEGFSVRPDLVARDLLGPGLYEAHKADKFLFPCVEDNACELSRSYCHMPFPGQQHAPATEWARSLRPHAYGPIHPRHTAVRELARKTQHLFLDGVLVSAEVGGVVPTRLSNNSGASDGNNDPSSSSSSSSNNNNNNNSSNNTGAASGSGGGGGSGETSSLRPGDPPLGVKYLNRLGGGVSVVAGSVAGVVAATASAAASASSTAAPLGKQKHQQQKQLVPKSPGSRKGAQSSSSNSSGSKGVPPLPPGAAGGSRDAASAASSQLTATNALKREQALNVLRKHLKDGGTSIVPVKEFKNLLRKAGLKNPELVPWLHGAPPEVSLGTNFEADAYDRPEYICLGSKSHLVNSPRWRSGPCS